MNTLEALKTRRSIRKFTDQVPSKELVDKVAEAGTWAPSGMNRQPAIVLAVTNPDMVKLLSEENAKVMGKTDIDPFYGAPVVLCVLSAKSSPTHVYDGALVMGNMLNAAHELGLGACWIHRCKEVFAGDAGRDILKGLGLDPDEYEGIGNCILGYPADGGRDIHPKENYVYHID